MSIREKTLEERFRKFEPIIEQSGCWRWPGHTNKSTGYGALQFGGVAYYAHRVSYEHFVGLIPEGHQIRHSCDNRWCFNPEHLSTGTIADNMRDKTERSRQARGSKDGNAKLNEEQVVEIWHRLRQGDGRLEISRAYGVSRDTIRLIHVGVTWSHLTSTL